MTDYTCVDKHPMTISSSLKFKQKNLSYFLHWLEARPCSCT